LSAIVSQSVGVDGLDVRASAKPAQDQTSDRGSTIAKGTTVSELSNNIWSVFQDSRNNYWFGSNGQGVFRYDGKTLTNFTTNDGLCDDQIRGIQGDQAGNVYINTPKGINRFDGKSFTTLEIPENPSPMSEWKVQPDDLWFGGPQNSGAVFRVDGETVYRLQFPRTQRGDEHYERIPRDKYPNAKYSPYDVYTIYRDHIGSMWFGTADLGACRFDGKSFDWLYEDHLTNAPNGGSFGIRSIIEDHDGRFWFCNTQYRFNVSANNPTGTESGLIHYEREKGIGDLRSKVGADYFYFASVIDGNEGDLWMATYGAGVWRYDGRNITQYPVEVEGKGVWIVSIYKDRQGVLWLGTNDAGAFRLNGEKFEEFSPGP
jgi:ligand-binding sensor domain-containing protein